MKILALTGIGSQVASTPAQQITPGWRIIYYLRRMGGSAPEEKLKASLGNDYYVGITKLTHGENPLVRIINS
jgi:hypothetical protein